MKSLLDKFEELSISLKALSEALLNFCRAMFFLAAASTFIYSSLHLHHLLPVSKAQGQNKLLTTIIKEAIP